MKIQEITSHVLFIECTEKIQAYEENRVFCLHDYAHFLEVVSIMDKINREDRMGYPDEWIYGAGLLHDIGKCVQYETGVPHQIAGTKIAKTILLDCGYSKEGISVILKAIKEHSGWTQREGFSELLRKADKLSRKCYQCEASSLCKWPEEMRNKRNYL